MAQRVEIIIEDDIDGSAGAHATTFALDGTTYDIDLSDAHSDELRRTLAEWIIAGRRVGSRRPTGSQTARLAAIREWARANSYKVGDRGRVSAEIQQAFQQAHTS